MADDTVELTKVDLEETGSLADLFLVASQELAKSDARLYRSVDRHLRRTRELLDREEDLQGTGSQPPQNRRQHDRAISARLLQGEPSYERQPRACLEQLCREHGIRGYSRMNKSQLITALKAQGVAAPAIPLQAFSKRELLDLIEELRHG